MNIVHIAPHLGGGVGKAHSALCAADDEGVHRHYLLLEEPRDERYVKAIRGAGAKVSALSDADTAAQLIEQADIVQIEWWNHPRLYAFLCRRAHPATRTVIWSHISGLAAPYIPESLFGAVGGFLFTSACSLEADAVRALPAEERARLGVVNSGFGFAFSAEPTIARAGRVGTLGTIDFGKLSPDFFEVIDRAAISDVVSVWGEVDADGAVAQRAAKMERRDAVRFHGHCGDPEAALREVGIFLYLLRPDHYGTAENALVEAMSLGCVPLVFDNPAERVIVEHGCTGFIERGVEAAVKRLNWMLHHPEAVVVMGREAARSVAETHTPHKSAAEFTAIYRALLAEPKRNIDYPALLGATPADWFLSTQGDTAPSADPSGAARKGTLNHFLHCFPSDPSLRSLLALAE